MMVDLDTLATELTKAIESGYSHYEIECTLAEFTMLELEAIDEVGESHYDDDASPFDRCLEEQVFSGIGIEWDYTLRLSNVPFYNLSFTWTT